MKAWAAGLLTISILFFLGACSSTLHLADTADYRYLRERAETQTFQDLTVSAAVPGMEETHALFGVPLYDHGIQPVWLEITNRGARRVRFALAGVDRDYFSPLEVSYLMRKGFSRESRHSMDERFHSAAIPRMVNPGQTISGFVFTHVSPGTKSFNVDLFGGTSQQNFAFFIDVPGFVPDHTGVEFQSLYPASEIRDLDVPALRTRLGGLICCTMDAQGEPDGLPLNVIMIGNGRDVLRALLRANWHESPADDQGARGNEISAYHLFGRRPDAVFRFKRKGKEDRTVLSAWLAPIRLDGEAVWLGQVSNFVGQRMNVDQDLQRAHLDPDIDDARNFLLQNMWYSQGLQAFAWLAESHAAPFDQPQTDFNGRRYFTDGHAVVVWLSGAPFSLLDTTAIDWDVGPGE